MPLFLASFLPAIFPDFSLFPYAYPHGLGNFFTGPVFVFAAINAVIASHNSANLRHESRETRRLAATSLAVNAVAWIAFAVCYFTPEDNYSAAYCMFAACFALAFCAGIAGDVAKRQSAARSIGLVLLTTFAFGTALWLWVELFFTSETGAANRLFSAALLAIFAVPSGVTTFMIARAAISRK